MVEPGEVLNFPDGVVGLEHLRRFVMVEDARIAPCRWLQSLDEPEIAFVVVDPRVVDASYAPVLPDSARGDLLAIITLNPEPALSTVNMLAPVVVDAAGREGRQLVLHESGYSLRQPIGSPPAPPVDVTAGLDREDACPTA